MKYLLLATAFTALVAMPVTAEVIIPTGKVFEGEKAAAPAKHGKAHKGHKAMKAKHKAAVSACEARVKAADTPEIAANIKAECMAKAKQMHKGAKRKAK